MVGPAATPHPSLRSRHHLPRAGGGRAGRWWWPRRLPDNRRSWAEPGAGPFVAGWVPFVGDLGPVVLLGLLGGGWGAEAVDRLAEGGRRCVDSLPRGGGGWGLSAVELCL